MGQATTSRKTQKKENRQFIQESSDEMGQQPKESRMLESSEG